MQLGPISSILLIASFPICISGLVIFLSKRFSNKIETFLVANRNLGLIWSSISIAVTWIWAPALFISSQKAYNQGIAGVFWFLVPNSLALVLIGYLSTRVRKSFKDGFTFPQFIRMKLGNINGYLYSFVVLIVQLYSIVLHLTAGLLILTNLTSIKRVYLILLLAVIFFILASFRGIKSALVTDIFKFLFLIIIVFVIIPAVIYKSGGISSILVGMQEVDGGLSGILNFRVFFTFGIAVSISLLSAVVIDQQQWQRAFSLNEKLGIRPFIYGAIFFASILLMLSSLGFLAGNKNLGIFVETSQNVGYATISQIASNIGVIVFVFTLMMSLIAAGASALCAASSIFVTDIYKNLEDKKKLRYARISMLIILSIGIMIALIPNIQIVYLLLLIGALRGALLIPTILTILEKKLSQRGVSIGIISGISVGLPVFIWGSFVKNAYISTVGSICSVLISALVCSIITKYTKYGSPKKSRILQKIVS